mgnify:CR=1 FL=1|tara:strand:- start:491 stop:715 length:225 start_codon:yes stop_codon:yes gene_type:complete
MKNPFTNHPNSVGETWYQHFKFSISIGIRLLSSGLYFIVHSIFPFIELHKKYNLSDTSLWLHEKNFDREFKKNK